MSQVTTAPTDGFSPKLQYLSDRFAEEAEYPWMLAAAAVLQTYKVMSLRVESVLGEHDDLTMSRYEILGLLDRADAGRMTVGDLKRATLLHPPTLTYTLDWLGTRTLVERETAKEDRRSVVVSITKKGRKMFERATNALSEVHFGLLGVEPGDALAVAHVLGRAIPD